MFERILVWVLCRICPATGGETAIYYIYAAAAAAGTAVTVANQVDANRRRQAILEQELRSNELAALDEENQRLIALREANDELLANAGGIEAWSSPSLIAARSFNFQMTGEDVENIRYNLASFKAEASARIGILQRNSRAAVVSGIFEIAQTMVGAKIGADKLAKPGEGQILKTGKKLPAGPQSLNPR